MAPKTKLALVTRIIKTALDDLLRDFVSPERKTTSAQSTAALVLDGDFDFGNAWVVVGN